MTLFLASMVFSNVYRLNNFMTSTLCCCSDLLKGGGGEFLNLRI